jgi:hypothetical protein
MKHCSLAITFVALLGCNDSKPQEVAPPADVPEASEAAQAPTVATATAPTEESGEKNYTVNTSLDPDSLGAGQEAELKITITPKEPWVLKTQTPFRAKLSCGSPCNVSKDVLTAEDMVDPKSAEKTVSARLSSNAEGKHKVDADLQFFLCTDEICQRYTDKTAAEFEVAKK